MSRRGTLWFGWTLACAAMAAFAALGAWQLGRAHDKRAMLDAVHRVLAAREAGPLAAASDRAQARGYAWAAGEGGFADAPAVLLDNQQRDGRAGVRAYRLFVPRLGDPLLVELGWLPLPGTRALPSVPKPLGALRVAGLLAPPPSAGIASAAPVAQADGTLLATALDAQAIASSLGQPRLAPRILKLDPAAPLGYARDLDILPNTLPPERHLGYAVQWFGLALAVLATALVLTLRKPRARPSIPMHKIP